MIKYNPMNERIKKDYFEWQKEANRKSDSTIDNIRKAMDRYEHYTKYDDFKNFHKQKAIAFKKHLSQTKSKQAGKPLSKATILSTLRHLKDFYKWLAYRKGYRRIGVNQIEYFNLTEKESREARGKTLKIYPTIEQIKAVLASMPNDNEIDKRNKGLIAFTLLTGMRDGAIASLKLKHIKRVQNLVEQKPDEVKTKFSKTIFTYYFPVGDDIVQIVNDWIDFLYQEKLFNDNDPVFPRTKIIRDDNFEFRSAGIEPVHWQSANQIRQIFKEAFISTGLDYFPPHSFRITLVRMGEQVCRTPEEFKAWSQNLGHEQVLTTFTSYGQIEEFKQGEIIRNLNNADSEISTKKMIKVIYDKINKKNEK